MNQKVKNLIQQARRSHPRVGLGVGKYRRASCAIIREQGFNVLLMLEATIGLNEVEDDDESGAPGSDAHRRRLQLEGPFTHSDVNFLKSLRITLPEELNSD